MVQFDYKLSCMDPMILLNYYTILYSKSRERAKVSMSGGVAGILDRQRSSQATQRSQHSNITFDFRLLSAALALR